MCTYCKGEKLIESTTTTHVVVLPKCTIIIRNVPCMECAVRRKIFHVGSFQTA